jgi:hypothetical protein
MYFDDVEKRAFRLHENDPRGVNLDNNICVVERQLDQVIPFATYSKLIANIDGFLGLTAA